MAKIYAGVLPYSFDPDGRLVFLLGREKPCKKPHVSNRWSDFGGTPEPEDASDEESAAREAYEESMGFLGTKEEIQRLIEMNKGFVFRGRGTAVFVVYIPYNAMLPRTYADVYLYMRRGIKNFRECRQKGFFEKTAVAWVTPADVQAFPEDYRPPFIRTFREILRHHPIFAEMA